MSGDYLMQDQQQKAAQDERTVEERLTGFAKLVRHAPAQVRQRARGAGRNVFTRSLDRTFAFVREHLTPLHWLLVRIVGVVLFLYVRVVAITSRLFTSGDLRWPDLPAPSVIALWHRDAPSLIVAFAKRRPSSHCTIMIASDPRGDYLTMLCKILGLQVVRGASEEHGWEALLQLGPELVAGACVIVTADGGGPARVAKWGAVALASAAKVPLIPLFADCHPAVEERHKWDSARNPVPFGALKVVTGSPCVIETLSDPSSLEEARAWLQEALNRLPQQT
jgi:lysophospholipid acyltransferase (LPLAT)-like uncharacterized protein